MIVRPSRSRRERTAVAAASEGPLSSGPRPLPFMLPTLAATVPRGRGWLFEIKWDGVRVQVVRAGGQVRLYARSLSDVTARYPEVARAAAALPGGDLVLDAEIVALDPGGRPSFHRLQRRMHRVRGVAHAARLDPVIAYAHDCLVLDDRDLRPLALRARKRRLARLLRGSDVVRYSEHVAGRGQAFFEEVGTLGLEGVVAKRAEAPYVGGRRREWLKIKCHQQQEFVVGGWTDPKGTRAHFGAMHIGVWDDGALRYVGRVGSSLPTAVLRSLHRRLLALAAERCPFTAGDPPRGREHHWVRPELVCEVRFDEWTPDGSVRAPILLGLRDDRDPRTVRREVARQG